VHLMNYYCSLLNPLFLQTYYLATMDQVTSYMYAWPTLDRTFFPIDFYPMELVTKDLYMIVPKDFRNEEIQTHERMVEEALEEVLMGLVACKVHPIYRNPIYCSKRKTIKYNFYRIYHYIFNHVRFFFIKLRMTSSVLFVERLFLQLPSHRFFFLLRILIKIFNIFFLFNDDNETIDIQINPTMTCFSKN
jgi:hypothetical protein